MAVDLCSSYDQEQVQEEEEDDYIDMEVSSYYNLLKSSPIHQQNEFEFHTQSGSLSRDHLSLTSPADELFYNGKLLPLLQSHYPSIDSLCDHKEEFYSTPLTTNATCTPVAVTPFLSCNVSPVESCQVSRELNPEEYFLECGGGGGGGGECHVSKKLSWTKKLKLIRQTSVLGSKIKASRAYIKYLFGKSTPAKAHKDETKIAIQESLGKESMTAKDDKICHRRSFSGAFKPRPMALKALTSSGSSSSSSSSSSNSNETQLFKRSSSANLDIENAIAGAIAHCKQSQSQELRSRKT